MHLPVQLRTVLFTFFMIFVLFLTAHTQVFANPNDVFEGEVYDFNKQRVAVMEKADSEDQAQVEGTGVTGFQMRSTMYQGILISGACPITDEAEKKYCPKQNATSAVSNMIGYLYSNPPASGVAYVHDVLAHAGLAKPAYAQGIGFVGPYSFLPFWRASRNVAYIVLIAIMVAIGFMVIFRMKIDPKTVISVQAALPKIVVTLLVITFSYAIVGFLIDIMYVAMAIAISIMLQGIGNGNTINSKPVSDIMTSMLNADIGTLFRAVFWGTADMQLVTTLPGAIGVIFAKMLEATALGWLAFLPLLLLGLVLALGLLFTFIRLLLLLANSYIQLLLGLILGPILLLPEAIPGRSAFKDWILNIIANLVVFPATAVIVIFSTFLVTTGQGDNPIWNPPFIGAQGNGALHYFLGISVMFLAPQLVAQVKKQFSPKPIVPATVGTAFAPVAGAAQTGMGAASQFYYLRTMPGIGKLLGGGQQGHG